MSTLFTDEKPTPYGEYPSRDAYIVLVLLGFIPFASLITAPLFAYKWPGGGWRLGLWACAPVALMFAVTLFRRYSHPLAGLVAVVTDPVLWGVVILSCLFAFVAARAKTSNSEPQQ